MFDRKRARKLAAGRIAIDGRIDLHGMRQADAHDALVAFLTRSVARGFRTVLVITGKGGAGADRSPDHTGATRGVLRRNVPRWLAEPALARVIVSFTEAHIRHGGAGALYIHLKSSGRT
ncbi:MAG: Smr/MutS family protein [Hyphomicrobiaceae bacterium]